jgi:hypothetical protein
MSINPYESPAQPKPDLPGVKYLVDTRKLTLGEWCQLTKYPLKGFWRWLSLRLGIDRNPTYIHTVPRVAEMVTELADMPAGVSEHLLQMQAFAETCGFFGRWTSTTVDSDGNTLNCILRMLSHDPRTYLEIAFIAIDHLFVSRHNLVSATAAGEFHVTSNGFPAGKRAPVVKPQYFKDLTFDRLLVLHQQRIDAWPGPFREVRTFEEMTTIVQELVDSFVKFQIARGYYTPLDDDHSTGVR